MSTTTGFKDIIDLPEWRPLANSNFACYTGQYCCQDFRNNEDRHPEIFKCGYGSNLGSNYMERYNFKNDEWLLDTIPLGNISTFGCVTTFQPSLGPRGTITSGTTTSIVLSTPLPSAIAVNALANRGDGRGYKIRLVDNAGGASGKTEERIVIGNTGGTTPTIYFDSAFSFTPTAGSTYEFLTGKIYMITNNFPLFRSYDVATNTWTALSNTGFAGGVSNGGTFLNMDELLVPNDRAPGEGFFGNLVATGTGATSLTGQVATGDSAVLINEYRNFQIRIVQDLVTPTAVGQRRRITSHTAGVSPVYTVPAWTVTPSATATYVIEQFSDNIIFYGNGAGSLNNYSVTGDIWDATIWAPPPAAGFGPAVNMPCYGLSVSDLGPGKESRHSHFFMFIEFFSQNMALFDISASPTGAWTSPIAYSNKTFYTLQLATNSNLPFWAPGTHGVYDPATNKGRFFYLNINATQHYVRFDVKNRRVEAWCFRPFPNVGPSAISANDPSFGTGNRMSMALFIDGPTKLAFINSSRGVGGAEPPMNVATEFFQCLAQR